MRLTGRSFIPILQLQIAVWLLPSVSLAGNDKRTPGEKDRTQFTRKVPGNPAAPHGGAGMLFTQNKGQIIDIDNHLRPDILYKSSTKGSDIYLRKTGLSYVFSNLIKVMNEVKEQLEELEISGQITAQNKQQKEEELNQKQILKVHRVDMDFVGANSSMQTIEDVSSGTGTLSGVEVSVKEEDAAVGSLNYYYPHCPQGVTDVRQYNKITYKNIYNNIDIQYYGGSEKGTKYDLIVNPHADPNQIKLRWTGAEKLIIKNGKLRIRTSINEFYESIPKVYQVIDGKVIDVKAKYKLDARHESQTSHLTSHIYETTFQLGLYNPDYPLIIDPATWNTYYGGSGEERGVGAATDAAGNPVFNGLVYSMNFPVNAGAYQNFYKGQGDAYVVKFDPNGARIFGTYIGGSLVESQFGMSITADKNNDIYITGSTKSTDFPAKTWFPTSYTQAAGGNGDAYISKFSPVGLLVWSTYYGGSQADGGYDIITDAANNVIFTGYTSSTNFPTKNPYQAALNNFSDAFIVKFNNKGIRQWATYYGGSGSDGGYGICVDQTNNIFACGNTTSTDFPLVNPGGAFVQVGFGGASFPYDAFLIKLNPATGFPLWSTCYGGPANDGGTGSGVAVDASGNVILCISTASTTNISTPGAYQPAYGGGGGGTSYGDVALIKFNSSYARVWATYVGGNNDECLNGFAIDAAGNSYVCWEWEDMNGGTYPGSLSCAYQPNFAGVEDFYIVKFNTNGIRSCGTYIGGPQEDEYENTGANNMAIFANDLYITGYTQGQYPVTAGAFQTIHGGGGMDAFMDKFCINLCEAKVLGLGYTASATNVCVNKPVTYTPSVNNTCDTTGYKFEWTFTGGSPATSTELNPSVTYPAAGNYSVKLVLTTQCKKDSLTKTSYINVTPCGITVAAAAPGTCPGKCSTVSATGSNGTAPYNYSWNTGALTQNISSCPLVNTTYTVTVTDAVGNTSTASTTVIILPTVSVSTTADNSTCNGSNKGIATATPSGGIAPYTYLWDNGQTTAIAKNLTAGNYTVTVTDSKGCTGTQVANVPAPTPVTITLSVSGRNVCPGKSDGYTGIVPMDGTPPYMYLWNTGGTNSLITNLTTGTYTVTVTDLSGCTATTAVTVGTNPSLALPTSSVPNNCTSGGIGSATVSPSGAPGGYQYSWSSGLPGAGSTGTLTGLKAGTYTVTVFDGNGCTASTSVNVPQGPPPPSSFTISPAKTVCVGTSVTFTNTSGLSGGSWLIYGFGSSNTNNFSATFNNPGTYIVSHKTVQNGCLAETIDTVVAVNCPAGKPGVGIVGGSCIPRGDCSKSITAAVTGGTVPYSYLWNTGATTQKIFPCPVSNGTYAVTVTDATGATNSATVAVTVGPLAAFTKTPPAGTVCTGTTVNYTGTTFPGATYSWTINNPPIVSGSSSNFSYTFLTAGNYIVNHTVSNATCGDVARDTINVINCSAAPTVTATSSSICSGSCAAVTSNPVGGTTPYVYAWSNGSSTQNINPCPALTTTYTLTVTDAGGKTATTTATVIVSPPLVGQFTKGTASCTGCGCKEWIMVNAAGGTSPYSYSWPDSYSKRYKNNLCPGSYTINIKDKNGCSINITVSAP
ncbi:MAG: SBBP repeat-containing protein [Bacteroidetes bacterium]|nr:SBBP repeat-containing protein [Bacteroidota bacterium]